MREVYHEILLSSLPSMLTICGCQHHRIERMMAISRDGRIQRCKMCLQVQSSSLPPTTLLGINYRSIVQYGTTQISSCRVSAAAFSKGLSEQIPSEQTLLGSSQRSMERRQAEKFALNSREIMIRVVAMTFVSPGEQGKEQQLPVLASKGRCVRNFPVTMIEFWY